MMGNPDLRIEAEKIVEFIFGRNLPMPKDCVDEVALALQRQRTEGFKEGKNDKTPIEWANHLVEAIENARKEGYEDGRKEVGAKELIEAREVGYASGWEDHKKALAKELELCRNQAIEASGKVADKYPKLSDYRYVHVIAKAISKAIRTKLSRAKERKDSKPPKGMD